MEQLLNDGSNSIFSTITSTGGGGGGAATIGGRAGEVEVAVDQDTESLLRGKKIMEQVLEIHIKFHLKEILEEVVVTAVMRVVEVVEQLLWRNNILVVDESGGAGSPNSINGSDTTYSGGGGGVQVQLKRRIWRWWSSGNPSTAGSAVLPILVVAVVLVDRT